jgi:hypothetical protein
MVGIWNKKSEKRYVKISIGNPEKKPLRPKIRLEDNIKMELGAIR